MYYFLRTDYILSSWFSKTRDKIIPGTAFLFLNKIVFIWASLFFAITGILKIAINIQVYVLILVLGGAIIMYGFQKRLEQIIQKCHFGDSLEKLPKQEMLKNRFLGIFYFVASFVVIFIIVLLVH